MNHNNSWGGTVGGPPPAHSPSPFPHHNQNQDAAMSFPSAMPLPQPFLAQPLPQPHQKIQFGVKQPVHPSTFDFGSSRRQDEQLDKQLKHAPAQAPRRLGMSNVRNEVDEFEEERREQRASRFAVQAKAVHQSGNTDSFNIKLKSEGNFDARDDSRDDNQTTTALESKSKSIKGDGSIVGSCEDMCPAQERQRRESMSDIQIFERLDPANPALTSAELAVKRFARTVDDPKPSDFRTRAALQKTMNHLRSLLDRTDVRFGLVHKFLWDRYRSVRQDLYIQGITDGFAIGIFEEIVRFHIMCEHELCGEDQSVTDMEGFNSHLNLEQMNKALISLNDMYDKATASGSPVSSESEFRAYHLVSLMAQHGKFKGDQQAFLSTLQALRPEVRNSPPLQWVLQLRASFVSGNFAKYFSLVRKAPYLLACLAHIYFGTMRIKAFKVISETFSAAASRPATLEITWLRRILGFYGELPYSSIMDMDGGNGNVCEDDGLLVSTATACGFAFAEPTANQGEERCLVVAKSQFVEPQAPLPRRPAAWISSKSPPQRSACVVVPFGSDKGFTKSSLETLKVGRGDYYSNIEITSSEQQEMEKRRVEGDAINEQRRFEEQKESLRRRQQLEMQAAAQEKERRKKEEAAAMAAAMAAAEAETRRQLELKAQARREEEARLKLEREMAKEAKKQKEREEEKERKRREEEKRRKELELELERQRLEAERRRLEEERKRIERQKALEEEMARRRRQQEEAAARKLQEAVETVRVKVLQRRYVTRWLENASRMATQRAREQRMAASLKACRVGIFQPPRPSLPSSRTGIAMGTATKQAKVSLDLRRLIASTLKSMMVADTVDEFTDILFWKVTVVDGAGIARARTPPSPQFRQFMARLQNDSGMNFCSSLDCYRSRIDVNMNVNVGDQIDHLPSVRSSKSVSIAIGVTGTSSLERSDAFHGSNGIIVVGDEIDEIDAKETRDYIKERLLTISCFPGIPLPPVLILAKNKDSTTMKNKVLGNADVCIVGGSAEELQGGLCWLINRGVLRYAHPLPRHRINSCGRDSLHVLGGPRVVPLERLLREALDAALEGCRSVYSMPFQVAVTYPTHLPIKLALEVLVKAVDEAIRSPEAVGQWPPRELCCDNYLQGEAGGKAEKLCNWYSLDRKAEILEVLNEIESLVCDCSPKQAVDINLETHELVAFYCHSVISNVLEQRIRRGLTPLIVVLPLREASALRESLHKLRSMHGVPPLLGSPAVKRVESPRKRKRSPRCTRVGLQLLINEVQGEVQAEKKACIGLLKGAARVGSGPVVDEIEMTPRQMTGESDIDQDVDKSQRDDSVIFRHKLQMLGDAIREERSASQSVWRKLYGAIASAVGLM